MKVAAEAKLVDAQRMRAEADAAQILAEAQSVEEGKRATDAAERKRRTEEDAVTAHGNAVKAEEEAKT
jgi:hypothetical protein